MKSETLIVVAALAAGGLIMAGTFAGPVPRGIRNHNPLNIREPKGGGDQWRGERATDDDPAFEEFDDPVWGIRAGARILKNYMSRYGLVTPRAILSRWAPPSENDTDAYVAHVAGVLGVGPDEPIAEAQLPELIAVMIQHENGQQPYSMALIREGVELA